MQLALYKKQLITLACLLVLLAIVVLGVLFVISGGAHHLITAPSGVSPSYQFRFGP